MTTNLQLAKLSDLVYEADGGASKIGQECHEYRSRFLFSHDHSLV